MRSLCTLSVLVLAATLTASVSAVMASPPAAPNQGSLAPASPGTPAAGSAVEPAGAVMAPGAEPAGEPVVEIERHRHRPSGFWTSTLPAKGGAYRYRLLAIGTAVALVTLGFMLWVIRRKGQPVA